MQACSEFELFQGVVLWAKHRVSDTEVTEALNTLMPFVRFPIMLPQQLQVKACLSSGLQGVRHCSCYFKVVLYPLDEL